MLSALILAAAVAAGPACPIQPATPDGLMQAERAWVGALQARDAAALGCVLDDGFRDNAWNGTVRDRAQMLAALAQRPAGAIELSRTEVRLGGTMGYIRGLASSPAGAARFIDVFVYRAGRWRAVAAQETPVR